MSSQMKPIIPKQEERKRAKPGAFITGDFDSYKMSNTKNEVIKPLTKDETIKVDDA